LLQTSLGCAAWLASVLLAACGGGGGSGAPAGTVVVPNTPPPTTFSVGGAVSGLLPGNTLWLVDNASNNTPVTANGAFTFSAGLAVGSSYAVTVLTQPPGQTCAVGQGSGTMGQASVTTVAVTCADNQYNVAVNVAGLLPVDTLVVQNNGADPLSVSTNGTSNFSATSPSGSSYAVSVVTQPAGEVCTVSGGQGAITSANVSVSIACAPISYSIGGTVAGLLSGNTVVLQDNGASNDTVRANGGFTFGTLVASGAGYAVSVLTAPTGQNCTVSSGAGTVAAANVSNVAVSCAANSYNVSAAVSGLLANLSLVLQNNGGENLTVSANGSATFGALQLYLSAYDVTVLTQPLGQSCTVASPTGTVGAGNVSVAVSCALNAGSGAGTGSQSLVAVPTATGNVVPIAFDGGAVSNLVEFNRPFVSVTLCTPGTSGSTRACQTIDHVVLDTGSYGLVLRSSAISANLNLPMLTDANAHAIGACNEYGGGYSWGGVRMADVYVGGELARSFLFSDDGAAPGGASTPPSTCTSAGSYLWTGNSSENGILGVGVLLDNFPFEYSCTGGSCSQLTAGTYLLTNLASQFAQDNNGLIVQVPAVAGAGVYSPTSGQLVFGIGTQANNAIGTATAYSTSASGDFSTTFNGTGYTSFLDTGSSVLYFDDASIPLCTNANVSWAYCPAPSPDSLNATNFAFSGGGSSVVNFSIYSALNAFNGGPGLYLANIGAPFAGFSGFVGSYFDWGLPFFFGRNVYVAFVGASTPAGVGPYWAY
jgi:hypothetical protein